MYLPRWLYGDADGVTCATAATDALAMAFYTDFVGSDDASTASIYFMPRTLTDLAGIADYEAADVCTNFPSACMGGYGFGDPNPVASYANLFCVQGVAVSWGAACSAGVEAVDAPTFSAADLWLTPAALSEISVTVPSSLR